MPPPEVQPTRESLAGSFRDPAGGVFVRPGRVLRVVSAEGRENVAALLRSRVAQAFIERGSLIGSRILEGSEAAAALQEVGAGSMAAEPPIVVEHERIPFSSFPYEWPANMLSDAAHLTLDLAEGLLSEGIGLKDGTPYNVLFRGAQPVFVDVLSLEPRRREDPVWLPYAQFVRTFLLPLLANKHFGVPLDQVFLTRRDGLEPEEVYRWCGPLRRLLPPFLGNVSIPTWLSGKAESGEKTLYQQRSQDPEKAEFILRSLFRRMRRAISAATASASSSRWSDYMQRTSTYSEGELATKKEFISTFLREHRPKRVLDVGCNTGLYSMMAADAGCEVVATDFDPVVVGKVYDQARAGGKNVLPLVVDFARPTPAVGWRNRECPSFLERSRQAFDAVFMLALVHHLLVTERVPLAEVVALAAEVTRQFLVIEYVGADDPMFRRLTRGRTHLHAGFTQQSFEEECSRRFDVLRKQPIKESYRVLYLLRRR